MSVKLVWITPDAEKLIGYMARVSNPKASKDDDATKLIGYLIDHKHWSPMEMASMCVAIETTRDVARQILRHRSFHFQEFSQRYSEAPLEPVYRPARLQDTKNRQNSLECEDVDLHGYWLGLQKRSFECAQFVYQEAIKNGIAKEVARAVLPEGMTKTYMYMSGTIRDWLHYLNVRIGVETQLEHREIARLLSDILAEQCPSIFEAARQGGLIVHAKPTE